MQEFAAQLPEEMDKREKIESIDLYFMKGSLRRKLGLGSSLPEYRSLNVTEEPEEPEEPEETAKIDYNAENISEFLESLPEELPEEKRKEVINIYKAMARNRKHIGPAIVEIRS